MPYCAIVVGQGVGDEVASVQGVEAQADGGQESESQAAEDQGNDAQSNEAQANQEVEVNLSASLNEWLQQSFPSIQDLRVLFTFLLSFVSLLLYPFVCCIFSFLHSCNCT